MASFGYLKHKLKNFKIYTTFLNSKFILSQNSNEENWIKSMYTEYITYSFSMAIGSNMFMIHETLLKKQKLRK